MTDDGRQGELMRRAQRVAAGFADTGLSQAEELLRRLSPEGRAQARRERAARARRFNRMAAQTAVAAALSLLVLVLVAEVLQPALAIVAAAAVMILLMVRIVSRATPRAPGRQALVQADLAALPEETAVWLAAQRRGLPAPAAALTDMLAARLDELAPQLARLDPRAPAADAVRTLVAVELPALVEGWREVPASLRGTAGTEGRSPNDQLVEGLQLIDAEVTRMTEDLARGARNDIATHRRYLELKYRGDGELGA